MKKKSKGKGSDDSKLKAKPKKFPKDLKGQKFSGEKRKLNEYDGLKKKTFKSKKWKKEPENSKDEDKHIKHDFRTSNNKLHKDQTDKQNKADGKPRKRSLKDDHKSNNNVKRQKMSGLNSSNKGTVDYSCYDLFKYNLKLAYIVSISFLIAVAASQYFLWSKFDI